MPKGFVIKEGFREEGSFMPATLGLQHYGLFGLASSLGAGSCGQIYSTELSPTIFLLKKVA
jgi:hypothetical protein